MKNFFLLVFLFYIGNLQADEGMWLIHLMEKINYQTMKTYGLELTPEQIYSETAPSVKDAIVAIDRGSCSGSIISSQGLMITNHHCAYSDLQKLSSLEHDYLKYGFWAKSQEEELVLPGKSVMFLEKVIEVTEEYRAILKKLTKPGNTTPVSSRRATAEICKKYAIEGYETTCESMFRGDKYYLFYYKVYYDVRLVGAPPASLGAFGGDTDNWSWPQHKCDFALYRIYTAPDGKPAQYNKVNIPLKPKYVLPVSTAGLKEKDFAMIIGYPGSTNRYLPSAGIRQKIEYENPVLIQVRDKKLSILREAMNRDSVVKLQYASKYFNSSNYWKFAIGENKYARLYDVIGLRKNEEERLSEWINASAERKNKYGDLLKDLENAYRFAAPYETSIAYHKEALLNGPEIFRIATHLLTFKSAMDRKHCSSLPPDCRHFKSLRAFSENHFKNYNEKVDCQLFAALLQIYVENIDPDALAPEIKRLIEKYKGNYHKLADDVYEKSFASTKEKLFARLQKEIKLKDLEKDPIFQIMYGAQQKNYALRQLLEKNDREIGRLRTLYTHALLEMNAGKALAPDANSTMRITYGTVGGYSSQDAVRYASHATIAGYKEKYIPGDSEFDLPKDYLALLDRKDWGVYASKDGKLYTDFITNQDITGGNSGSPVMNAKGELVGLAFDGNWESMAGDLYYHPEWNKSVCVDIRFVLWCIDKYAGAGHLLQEMNIKTE